VRMRSCGVPANIPKNIRGSHSSWRDVRSRSSRLRWPIKWRASLGPCWPRVEAIGCLGSRQPEGARQWKHEVYVRAFMNCRGDDDVDAKRSRPSIGKTREVPREEREADPNKLRYAIANSNRVKLPQSTSPTNTTTRIRTRLKPEDMLVVTRCSTSTPAPSPWLRARRHWAGICGRAATRLPRRRAA
jgi:hypothetical protein